MVNIFLNQVLPIFIFLVISIVYFVVKYNNSDSKLNILSYIIYCLALFLSQLIINVVLTNQICGSAQWVTTFVVTFIPWVLIFGVLNVVILNFPGWLKPFSNTFGYLAVSGKIKEIFDEILAPTTTGISDVDKVYDNLSNQTLLINEIPPGDDGFKEFIDSLKKHKPSLLKSGITENTDEAVELKKLVILKNPVSEFVWFVLTGILTILASYNYIINSSCSLTVQEINKNNENAKAASKADKNALNAEATVFQQNINNMVNDL